MDVDGDGLISILDLTVMTHGFGTNRLSGPPGYDFRADLDWDNAISALDLAKEGGATCFNQPPNAQHTTFVYDDNGALLKRTNTNTSTTQPQASTSTIYIGGIFEQSSSSATGITGKTKYYVAYGRAIAVRQSPVGGTETLSYLLADQLGTTVGSIDAMTGTVSSQKYWPYGATRASRAR